MKIGSAFNIGRLFGIPFRVHYSWFAIFLLITVSLSWRYFPLIYPFWSQWLYWTLGIVTSLLFFASVVTHELAHSLVARHYGIQVGSITLFILGGVAQITREAPRPGIELKMAAAGPVCSLVIGGLFGLLWFLTNDVVEPVAALAFWLAQVNGVLALFNLIPGFPLDGGRIFRSLMWHFTGRYRRSTQVAVRVGQGFGYLCIAGGVSIVAVFGEWIGGLWLVFIGWFLENAASSSYRQVKWRDALHGLTASQVMTSIHLSVPSGITIRELVQNHIFITGRQQFVVADGSQVEGLVTLEDIKAVPRSAWETTPVSEIMTPVDRLEAIHPDQEALSVLEQMEASGINQMPVVSEGRVIGLINRDSLVRLMRTRSELGV